jgi:hypothetical protein
MISMQQIYPLIFPQFHCTYSHGKHCIQIFLQLLYLYHQDYRYRSLHKFLKDQDKWIKKGF